MAQHNQSPYFDMTDLDPDYVENPNPYASSPLFDGHHHIIDDDPSNSQTQSTAGTTPSTSTSTTKRRKKTSNVWDHFEEQTIMVKGGVLELKAKYKWQGCTSVMSMQSGGGNGHMRRHIQGHMKKAKASDAVSARVQSTLQFNPDGSVRNFTYDPSLQREYFVV